MNPWACSSHLLAHQCACVAKLDLPAALDVAPTFADGAIVDAHSTEVLRSTIHLQKVAPPCGLSLSTLHMVPAAGGNMTIEFQPLDACSRTIFHEGDFEALESPIGSGGPCSQYCMAKSQTQTELYGFLETLPGAQVRYYLLKPAANASRLNYWARTTPCCHGHAAFTALGAAMLRAAASCVNQNWSDIQTLQAAMPARPGGLGLRQITHLADAAYIASCVAAQTLC